MKINHVNTYTSNKAILEVVESVVYKRSFNTFQVKKVAVAGEPVEVKVSVEINTNNFQDELEKLETRIIQELQIVFGNNEYEILFNIKNMNK